MIRRYREPCKLVLVPLVFFSCASAKTANLRFEFHKIAEIGQSMGQTSLVDIDKDGDLDWVVGERTRTWWFEYVSPDEWIQHDLGKGIRTDVGGCAFDIDGDGWIDQFCGTGWYRNTGRPRTETFEPFESGTIVSHDSVPVDVDGDGRLDVVACGDQADPGLVWYTIPLDPRRKWVAHGIGGTIHGGVGPLGVGDLDGDGDTDVVRGDAWFENVDGKGIRWTEHADLIPLDGNRPERYGLALKVWVIDLDLDGDPDIVEAEADTPNGRTLWFENKNHGKSWQCHLISSADTGQDFHSLAVADFDGDGDVDVFSGGGPLSRDVQKCFIWENLDGKAGRWKEHLLLEGRRSHEAKAADVDGDGDIDICTKPWRGSLHFYLRNMLVEDSNEANR